MTYEEMIKHFNRMLMNIDYERTQELWATAAKMCEDSEYRGSHIDYIYSTDESFEPDWTITSMNGEKIT